MADEDDSATLTVKVTDQQGGTTHFKVKKTTKFGKIFKAYSKKKGISESAMRFLMDGERINKEDTPKMLEMEDGDEINVMLQQEGGGNGR